MKILSISLDKAIFQKDSEAQKRQIEYGRLFEETHIIVFSRKGFSEEKISGNVWLYPTNSLNKIFYIFDAFKIGSEIIKERKVDIIATQDPFETGLVGWGLKKKFRIPLLIQIHTETSFRYFALESFLNLLRWLLAHFLIPRSDRLRVVSKDIKDYFIRHFNYSKKKIFVLPVVIEEQKIKNHLPKIDIKQKYPGYDFYFLTIARLVKCKNIPFQLKVFSKLIKEFPKIILIIVGDGPERDKLEKIIQKLSLQRNVFFEGWQEDVISYLKTSDCFLLSSNYEGYGRTIIEALASGIPIIATKVGIAKVLIKNGENGYLVEVGDIEEYYRVCKKMIKHSISRERILKYSPFLLSRDRYFSSYKEIFDLENHP